MLSPALQRERAQRSGWRAPKQTIDFTGSTDVAHAVAVDGSQRVIVTGRMQPSGGHSDFALARLTSGGALDGSFDGDGRVETDFFTGVGSSEVATSLAIQADGRIVAGGTGGPSTQNPQFILARFNTNGSPDTASTRWSAWQAATRLRATRATTHNHSSAVWDSTSSTAATTTTTSTPATAQAGTRCSAATAPIRRKSTRGMA